MKDKLVIWGASGHAMIVADIIELMNIYEIVGFLDDINPVRHNTQFCGLPILGGREQLDDLKRKGVGNIIFGFGNCKARLNLSKLVRDKGFTLATAIHPQSIIAKNVSIGAGTVIAAGAVVNAGSKIGENVIINTLASIDHECIVENGVHICPGVRLAGRVTVGYASWLSIGVIVIDNIRIGARTVIGAGAVVVEDIPDGVKAYGVPARVIKMAGEDE